jgi:hypothetical protein
MIHFARQALGDPPVRREAASRVDAVLDASQEIFDQVQARGLGHEIDRAPLIETGRGLLEPLLGSGL